MEVIHVMFYNEVYGSGSGTIRVSLHNSRKSPGNLLHIIMSELPPLLNHMPPDSR